MNYKIAQELDDDFDLIDFEGIRKSEFGNDEFETKYFKIGIKLNAEQMLNFMGGDEPFEVVLIFLPAGLILYETAPPNKSCETDA